MVPASPASSGSPASSTPSTASTPSTPARPATFLTTPRLRLREFTRSDEDMEDLYRLESDPRVMRYIGLGVARSREQVRGFLDRIIEGYARYPGLGMWMAHCRGTGNFIGWFELGPLADTDEIEVGYRLLPEYWGIGLATEGGAALRDHGFSKLGLSRIVGIAHPDNGASRRVLEKIGLKFERMDFYYDMDVAYYSLNQLE